MARLPDADRRARPRHQIQLESGRHGARSVQRLGHDVVSAALLGRKYVGIDQSEAYVGYARKRLEHALQNANGAAAPEVATAAVSDPNRASKVMTETDAFGQRAFREEGPRKPPERLTSSGATRSSSAWRQRCGRGRANWEVHFRMKIGVGLGGIFRCR